MPEERILLCGPALSADECAESLEQLRRVTLPGAAKYVVTATKFDTQRSARTFNPEAEAGYPAEPAYLQTLAAWAEFPYRSDPCFRDAYDVFCMRQIVARHGPFDYAILIRRAGDFENSWPELQSHVDGRLFLTFEPDAGESGRANSAETAVQPNLLVRLADARSVAFLEMVSEFYSSGAAYSLTPYSLDRALAAAADALQLEQEIASQ